MPNPLYPYTLPSRSKSLPTDQNLSKSMATQTHCQTVKIKHGHTTKYIKHLAESANFKGGTFNKHRNGLIGNRFEMPNVSYTHPLGTILKNDKTLYYENRANQN